MYVPPLLEALGLAELEHNAATTACGRGGQEHASCGLGSSGEPRDLPAAADTPFGIGRALAAGRCRTAQRVPGYKRRWGAGGGGAERSMGWTSSMFERNHPSNS